MTTQRTTLWNPVFPGASRMILTLLLSLIAVTLPAGHTAAVWAQEATPIAPGGAPAPTSDCGERLGIGDTTVACLTFVHASSDAGSVDISIDGTVVFSGVGFGSTTGFIAVPAGSYDLSITAAGQPDSVLIDHPGLEVNAGAGTEFAIVGSRVAATLQGLVLPIDPAASSAGTARLRVVQAIPDAPPLDVAVTGGETLISNLAPLSASGYLDVPAAATSIEVHAAGSPDVLFPIPDFSVPDGATVTIYALGTVTNPTGITLLSVLVPAGGESAGGAQSVATPVATPAA